MNNGASLDELEKRAAAQRAKIHGSVEDFIQLRADVRETVREKLDVRRQVRQHFWPATGVATFVALVVGFKVAGVFFD